MGSLSEQRRMNLEAGKKKLEDFRRRKLERTSLAYMARQQHQYSLGGYPTQAFLAGPPQPQVDSDMSQSPVSLTEWSDVGPQGGGQPPPHPASPEPQQPPFNHMRTEPVSPTGNRISSVSSSPESQRAQKSLATHYLSDSQDFEFDSPPTKSLGGLAGDPSATNGYADVPEDQHHRSRMAGYEGEHPSSPVKPFPTLYEQETEEHAGDPSGEAHEGQQLGAIAAPPSAPEAPADGEADDAHAVDANEGDDASQVPRLDRAHSSAASIFDTPASSLTVPLPDIIGMPPEPYPPPPESPSSQPPKRAKPSTTDSVAEESQPQDPSDLDRAARELESQIDGLAATQEASGPVELQTLSNQLKGVQSQLERLEGPESASGGTSDQREEQAELDAAEDAGIRAEEARALVRSLEEARRQLAEEASARAATVAESQRYLADLQEARRELAEMRVRGGDVSAQTYALAEELAEVKDSLALVTESRDATARESRQLMEQLADARLALEHATAGSDELMCRVRRADEELALMTESRDVAAQEAQALLAQLQEAQEEVAEMYEKQEQFDRESKTLADELDAVKSELEQAKSQLAQTVGVSSADQPPSADPEIERKLAAELDEAKRQLAQVCESHDAANQELLRLQDQLQEAKLPSMEANSSTVSDDRELGDVHQRLAETEAKLLAALESSQAEVQSSETLNTVRTQLESMQRQYDAQVQKTAELQTLEEERSAQVERAQRDLDEAKAAHAESEAKMSARVEELTKKFKMARKALKESKDGAANMQEQVHSATARCDSLTAELSRLESASCRRAEELTQQLASLEDTVSVHKDEKLVLKEDLEKLRSQSMKDMQAAEELMQGEMAALQASHAEQLAKALQAGPSAQEQERERLPSGPEEEIGLEDPSAAPLQLAGAHVMKLARELDACKRAATRLEDEGANAALLRAEGRVQQLYQELKHLKRPSEDACQESPAADARADKEVAVEQLTQELEALRIAQANAETEKQELAAKEAASQKELEATKTTLKEAMRRVKAYKTKGMAFQETAQAQEAKLKEEEAALAGMQEQAQAQATKLNEADAELARLKEDVDIQAAHLARALEERDSWLQQKGTLEQQLQDQGRLAEEAREADQERAQRLRDTVAELEQTVAGCQSRLSEQAGVMAKLEAELASAHEARDTALAEQVSALTEQHEQARAELQSALDASSVELQLALQQLANMSPVTLSINLDASDVSAQHEAEKAALQHALDEKSSELHRAVQQVDEARRVSLSITLADDDPDGRVRISQVGAFADAKALQQQLDAKSLELDQALRDLAEARGSAAQSEADGRADAAPGAVSLEDEELARIQAELATSQAELERAAGTMQTMEADLAAAAQKDAERVKMVRKKQKEAVGKLKAEQEANAQAQALLKRELAEAEQAAKDELSRLERDLLNARETSESELAAHKLEAEAALAQAAAQHREHSAELLATTQTLENQLEVLREAGARKQAELGAEMERLGALADEARARQADSAARAEQLAADVEAALSERDALQVELARAQERSAAKEGELEAALATLTEQLATSNETSTAQAQAQANLQLRAEALEEEVRALQEAGAEKQRDMDSACERLSTLAIESNKAAKVAQSQSAVLEKVVAEGEASRGQLAQQLDTLRREAEAKEVDHRGAVAALKEDIAQARQEAVQVESVLKAAMRRCKTVFNSKLEVEQAATAQAARTEELQQEISAQATRIASMESQSQALQEQLYQSSASHASTLQELERSHASALQSAVEQALAKGETHAAQLQADLTEKEKEASAQQGRFADLEAEVAEARTLAETRQSEAAAAARDSEARMLEAQAKASQLEQEKEAAISELAAKLEAAAAEHASALTHALEEAQVAHEERLQQLQEDHSTQLEAHIYEHQAKLAAQEKEASVRVSELEEAKAGQADLVELEREKAAQLKQELQQVQSTHSVRVQELEQQLGAMDARMATELAKVGALREALAAAQETAARAEEQLKGEAAGTEQFKGELELAKTQLDESRSSEKEAQNVADARAEALGEALFRSDEQAGSLTEANNQIAKLQERMVALESGDINQRLPVIKQMLGVDRLLEENSMLADRVNELSRLLDHERKVNSLRMQIPTAGQGVPNVSPVPPQIGDSSSTVQAAPGQQDVQVAVSEIIPVENKPIQPPPKRSRGFWGFISGADQLPY